MTAQVIVSVDISTSKKEIEEVLEKDGCVIIRNAMDHGIIDEFLGDLSPFLQKKSTGNGNFTGFETKRLHSLFTKSDRAADFVTHDKLLDVADIALGRYCDSFQLNSQSITAIGPRESVQPLHRDDLLYPLAHDGQRNACCTSFWALSDFTAENGATRLVPGSHLWDDVRQPTEEETVQAIMPKGSFCMFLGGVYHGGGQNFTDDQWRMGMFVGYTLGWLRQEQNFYMAVPPELAKTMPEKLARLLGYSIHRPFLGWIQDIQDPWDVLHGYEELSRGGDDQFAAGETKLVQGANVDVGYSKSVAGIGSSSPKQIQTVDPDVTDEQMGNILETDGCVIVRELMAPETIDRFLDDLSPYLGKKPTGESDFLGYETKRLHSLFAKSGTVSEFVGNDFVMSVLDKTLGPYCDMYQLSSNSITAIGPGETPQPLHRGDNLYPLPHPSKRNLGCTAFWALTDFTEENGATRLIPQSHLWDDIRKPEDKECVQAVMSKGSACFFVSGIYHGGGSNITKNEWRIAMFAGYILGWLRQEQNFYLTVTPQEAAKLSERVGRLLGYGMHRPFLGWVHDLQDPWDVINGYEELSSAGSDLYANDASDPVQGPKVAVL